MNKVFIFFSLVLVSIAAFLKYKSNMSTAKKMMQLLTTNGIPNALALLIVAQSKHETALAGVPFMSKQCLVNKNYFGYGYVKGNKYQIADGGKHPEDSGHYAKYSSMENSVLDIVGYYSRRKNVFFSIQDYKSFSIALKSAGYYTDKSENYTAGVKKFYQNIIA